MGRTAVQTAVQPCEASLTAQLRTCCRPAPRAGLQEADVHDVLNVFMCTGFTRGTNQYFTKPSPVRKGDYLEFLGGWRARCAGAPRSVG